MPTLSSVITDIERLSEDDIQLLKTYLLTNTSVYTMEDFVREERFAGGRVCPFCGCVHISRNGHTKKGKQRYFCNDCKKSFVITSNSIVSK